MMERLYKVLGDNGQACNGGTLTWDLPRNGRPGAWQRVEGPLEPCRRGLHLCRVGDLVLWLGPTIWVAEARGARIIVMPDKVVVSEARLLAPVETWTETTARLFAATCARRALEREHAAGRSVDARSWRAVEVAESYAAGEASGAQLAAAGAAARDAAWDAAWTAAGDAAWTAAGDAERAWQTELFTSMLAPSLREETP